MLSIEFIATMKDRPRLPPKAGAALIRRVLEEFLRNFRMRRISLRVVRPQEERAAIEARPDQRGGVIGGDDDDRGSDPTGC
jgi:hypothetical protein